MKEAFAVQIVLLCLAITSADAQTDQTEVANAFGIDVVDAVISRIQSSCQLSELWDTVYTGYLLRRIAYVESRDGLDQDTFRQGYDGGMWQVDEALFLATQNPAFEDVQSHIQSDFNIAWNQVTWSDLRKPLHSALAAGMYLETYHSELNSTDIRIQANFWAMRYHENGSMDRDPNEFIYRINAFNMDEDCRVEADVMFVLDSSGSINNDNYEQVLQFAYNFTNELIANENITQDGNRVGVIIFGNEAHREIDFDTYNTKFSLLNAIANLPYLSQSTNTADALCELKSVDWRSGALQLAVLLTDGQSNKPSETCPGTTIEVAEQVHTEIPTLLIYVIGVTDSVHDEELFAIATTPNDIDYLDSFHASNLRTSQDRQYHELCYRAALPAIEGNALSASLDRDGSLRYQFIAMENVTIRLCVFSGMIRAYFAYDIPNPSSAHNFRVIDLAASPQTIRCEAIQLERPTGGTQNCMNLAPVGRKRRQTDEEESFTVFVAIEGMAENNNFAINSTTDLSELETCGIAPCRNAECADTLTGYECNCFTGFEKINDECTDIDECEALNVTTLQCHEKAVCVNTQGSYQCNCLKDYEGNGILCTPVVLNASERFIIIMVAVAFGLVLITSLAVAATIIYCMRKCPKKNGLIDIQQYRHL